jgi:hypothetical protein
MVFILIFWAIRSQHFPKYDLYWAIGTDAVQQLTAEKSALLMKH